MSEPCKNGPKVALVTGGAKRVGRAIVERLAAAGFSVAFTYNASKDAADALVAGLLQKRIDAAAVQADLSEPSSALAIGAWFRARFSRLDLLVNSASMYIADDEAAGASAALQAKLFTTNSITPARLMSEFAPDLARSHGSVVNFIDILAERPMPGYSAYCASKAALHASTLAYARKLGPGVRVNGIAPGVIEWPDEMPEADRAAYLRRVPLARAGTPSEAAELVHFLATGGTYITGQIIRIDGGRSIM